MRRRERFGAGRDFAHPAPVALGLILLRGVRRLRLRRFRLRRYRLRRFRLRRWRLHLVHGSRPFCPLRGREQGMTARASRLFNREQRMSAACGWISQALDAGRRASHQVSERVKTADAKCRTRFTFAVRRTATRGGTRNAPHRGRRLVPWVFSNGQTPVSESLILCRMANGPSLPSAWWTRAELPMNRSDDD
jgi:hypothetical protein